MQLEYGNWIRKKNLLVLGLCTLGMGLLLEATILSSRGLLRRKEQGSQ